MRVPPRPDPTSRGCTRRRRRVERERRASSAARAKVWARDGALLAMGTSQLLCRPAPDARSRSLGAVEDRITPGLYLEMTDRPLDAYARDRVPEVLGAARRRAGHLVAQRAPRPRRSPAGAPRVRPSRRLRGRRRRSRAPPTPAGITGHHFRHYRRPGPGRRHRPPDDRAVARADLARRSPTRAQELRDWADFVHIRHIAEAAVPGYCMITPYENVDRRRSALHALLRDGHRRSRDARSRR